jgi:hypothetical protein
VEPFFVRWRAFAVCVSLTCQLSGDTSGSAIYLAFQYFLEHHVDAHFQFIIV